MLNIDPVITDLFKELHMPHARRQAARVSGSLCVRL